MKKILLVLLMLILLVVLEIIRELHCFKIRRYKIKVPELKNKKIKIMFLSDLHGKTYGENNKQLIEAMKKEEPDLILSGGDLLTRGDEKSDSIAVSFLKEAVKIAPLYVANGNHEEKMHLQAEKYCHRYEKYIKSLEKEDLTIIENGAVNVEIKGFPIRILAMELPVKCYELFHRRELSNEEIEERIGRPDSSRYQILMAHNPIYMEEYAKWGADLTLSGHLHGGVVRLPFIGGVVTPQVRLFPKYSGGMYVKGKHTGIVSRGLGTHTVNIRLFNMAEIVMITLTGE